jgi:glutamine---fructose-6-phosphate transaminase (isomerizing)
VCGIVGYVGSQQAWPIILEGLKRLEYRGYDSAGIVIKDSYGQLHFRKTVGKVNGLDPRQQLDFPKGYTGLGHTRWATHGRPSDSNAHPHTECRQQVAVVHNGIVENFLELKRGLLEEGHHFSSETDTEVIAHLIEKGLAQGLSFEEAFRRLGGLLEGSQAIAAIQEGEDGKICALRLSHAGGIVVAHRDGQGIIGSDLPAMLPLLRQASYYGYVGFLEAGEMAVVTREEAKYLDLKGNTLNKQLRQVTPEEVLIDKGGYRHFMLKEIMEQPQAVAAALRERVDFERGRVELPDFPISDADLRDLKRVMLIGCGTSLHAAQVGRHLMEQRAGLPAEAESASEFRYRNAYINDRTLYVSIAQSGETADTVAAMQEIRARGGRLITICNVACSQTTRLAEGTLYMHSGIEIGVASTKTFIASLTILNLLGTYLGQVRGVLSPEDARRLVDDLAQCPRLIGEMLADTSAYQRLARRFYTYNNFLFLGRGINAPIALEGALKLKEVSYIHAEGYPAGEMKHGPIALIDQGMATLALAPRDSLYDKMVNNVKEVKARDGVILAVVTQGDAELPSEVDEVIYIPQAPEYLSPLLATIPMQLLAYHIAVQRGCDVDQPRNLAKSVTVE